MPSSPVVCPIIQQLMESTINAFVASSYVVSTAKPLPLGTRLLRSKPFLHGTVASTDKPLPLGTRLLRSKLFPPGSVASVAKPLPLGTRLLRSKLLLLGSVAYAAKPLPLFHNNLSFYSKFRTLHK
ncbi:hypothetical protein Adt_41546 [Abeliophyllum distichum]|uniref:Uncharacterized protein n=1 Tax=Abeliophyllum distichum TaxID=126358 RepID=A0ABD1PP56_9LAMI